MKKKFVCITCKNDIWDYPDRKRKYCSRKCMPLGYMHTKKSRKKMSDKAKMRVGKANNFFGKKHTKNTKELMRSIKLLKPVRYWKDKKRPNITALFKGKWVIPENEAKYGTKHDRVRKMWGTPMKCELCGNTKKKSYDWSNKDHKYKIVRKDWQRLCRKCHIEWDKKYN